VGLTRSAGVDLGRFLARQHQESSLDVGVVLTWRRTFGTQRARDAVREGAKVVFWSEGAVPMTTDGQAGFIAQASQVAVQEGIYLGQALQEFPPDFPMQPSQNKIIWINPSGDVITDYYKSFPVPGEPVVRGQGVVPEWDTPYGRMASDGLIVW
jgi:hypothetical protein